MTAQTDSSAEINLAAADVSPPTAEITKHWQRTRLHSMSDSSLLSALVQSHHCLGHSLQNTLRSVLEIRKIDRKSGLSSPLVVL